jgi:signal transduction histidine kinase
MAARLDQPGTRQLIISKTLRWTAAIAAAVSLGISVYGLLNMRNEFQGFSESQRAGPLWHATQLQSEFMRFEQALLLFATGNVDVTVDEVQFRFDILWSRISVADRNLESVDVDNKPDTAVLDELAALLAEEENRIEVLGDGNAAEAMSIFSALHVLEDEIHDFTISVKEVQARLDASTRAEFLRLSKKTMMLALIVALGSMTCAGLFFLDSQRQRRISLQNRELAHRAEQAYQAKSDFISNVNHELRTPLTSIRGALAILDKSFGNQVPEHLRKIVSIAHRNCRRLEILINDVLDFEKLEVGLNYNLQALDLRTCVTDAVSANRSYDQQNNCNLVAMVPDEPVAVMADEGRLVQLMANLISNAIKFSNEGGDVIVSLTKDHVAEIRVQDFGIGIAPDFRDKVFDRFSQADATATRKYSGSGLGMCISKSIVEAHGGKIRFESEVGAGTTFIVELPLLVETESPVFENVA